MIQLIVISGINEISPEKIKYWNIIYGNKIKIFVVENNLDYTLETFRIFIENNLDIKITFYYLDQNILWQFLLVLLGILKSQIKIFNIKYLEKRSFELDHCQFDSKYSRLFWHQIQNLCDPNTLQIRIII